jgi:hypothetical protein
MGTVQVTGLRDLEVEQIEDEAEIATDGNVAKYARRRLRAGMRLWDASGNFNPHELDKPFERESEAYHEHNDTHQTSTQSTETIKQVLYNNLSTSDPIKIDSDNDDETDIIDLVIEDLVITALEELQDESKITYKPRKGYIKNE